MVVVDFGSATPFTLVDIDGGLLLLPEHAGWTREEGRKEGRKEGREEGNEKSTGAWSDRRRVA